MRTRPPPAFLCSLVLEPTSDQYVVVVAASPPTQTGHPPFAGAGGAAVAAAVVKAAHRPARDRTALPPALTRGGTHL